MGKEEVENFEMPKSEKKKHRKEPRAVVKHKHSTKRGKNVVVKSVSNMDIPLLPHLSPYIGEQSVRRKVVIDRYGNVTPIGEFERSPPMCGVDQPPNPVQFMQMIGTAYGRMAGIDPHTAALDRPVLESQRCVSRVVKKKKKRAEESSSSSSSECCYAEDVE